MRFLSLMFFCLVLSSQVYSQTCTMSITSQTNVNCKGASTGSATVSVAGSSGTPSTCVSPQTPGSTDDCSSGCTTTISASNSSTAVTAASGQKICITGNNYTGVIQVNAGGKVVICGTGAAPSNVIFNGGQLLVSSTGAVTIGANTVYTATGSTLTNYGTVSFSSALTANFLIQNHKTFNVAGGLTFDYNSQGLLNTGTLTVSSGNFVYTGSGTGTNSNTITITSGSFLSDWSKTFTNNCTINVGTTFTNHGTFTNNGKINVTGATTLDGGSYTASAGSELTTSTVTFNNGTVSGTGASCSSIKATGAAINNSATFSGQIRICGSSYSSIGSPYATCSCNVSAPTCSSYVWKNSALVTVGTTATVSSLPAGVYTVTASCTGCSNTPSVTVTITEPSTALSFTKVQSNISCNGLSDGSITITATGGTGTVTYSKDNAVTYQSSNVFSGLAAGSYSVLVKDANACSTAVQNVTITAPSGITATIAKTDITCNGVNNGSITVTAGGGTGTLQYSKDGGVTYQASNAFTALAAGSYAVVVKDANNCATVAQNITIATPAAISVTATATDATCNGSSNGSITVSASGGTGTLTYSKDNGTTYQASGNFTGIAAGTYAIVVKDANGCKSVAQNVTVNQPVAPTISTSKTDVTCFGAANGSATVTVAGGGGGIAGANNCSSISPQDCSAGCTATFSANTGSITMTGATDKICLTATNFTGSINLTTGGTLVICGSATPSSFSISNGSKVIVTGTGSLTLPSLAINNPCSLENYGTVTVNGNMTNYSTVLNSKTLNITGDFSDNGGANLTNLCTMTVGGNTYNYGTINNKGTVTVGGASNINGGALIIMDNGTQFSSAGLTLNGTIQGPASGNCSSVKVNGVTTINGGASITGQLSLCDANGVETNNNPALSGYLNCTCNVSSSVCTYSWKNAGGTVIGTTASISGLSGGTYTVTTTCGGCTSSPVSVTVAEPTLLTVTVTGTISCSPLGSGTAAAAASGGTTTPTSYTYLWSPNNATTSSLTALTAGTYSVTVTDANLCTATGSYTVVQSPPLVITLTRTGRNIVTSVAGGLAPYTYLWNTPSNQTSANQSNLPYGTYTLTVTGADGCSTPITITLTPPVIQIDTKLVDVVSVNLSGAVLSPSNPYTSGPAGGPSSDGIIPVTPQIPAIGTTAIITLEILQGPKNVPMHISFVIDENANISAVKADTKNDNTFNVMVSDYYKIDNTNDDTKKIAFYKYKQEPVTVNFTTNLVSGLVLDQISDPANKFIISGLTGYTVQSLKILDLSNNTVKLSTLAEWDGTNNSSVAVSKGTYKFELTVTDASAANFTYKGQLILRK